MHFVTILSYEGVQDSRDHYVFKHFYMYLYSLIFVAVINQGFSPQIYFTEQYRVNQNTVVS